MFAIFDWDAATEINVTGHEPIRSRVKGRQRQAFHVLGSSINENVESAGSAVIHILTGDGPDVVLNLSPGSPARALSQLTVPMAALRNRRTSSPSSGAPASAADELAKAADLLDRGLLTPEEFAQLKARILGM